jgi:hypothetical protein
MNIRTYNLFLIFTIFIILYSLWYFSKGVAYSLELPSVRYKEAFVPKIFKETYRPIHRNIRMTYEGFYDKTSADISNLFRKFGIL